MGLLKIINAATQYLSEARIAKARGISTGSFGLDEKSVIDYDLLVDIYEKDPTAGFVVDGTVRQAVGTGYYYQHDGSLEGEEQVKILEEFNSSPKVLMRGLSIKLGTYLYGMGFAPAEPRSPSFLQYVSMMPLRSTWYWRREQYGGDLIYIKQRYKGVEAIFDINKGEIIPFIMNENADNPLGRGILHRLAETAPYKIVYSDDPQNPKEFTRPSMYRAKQMLIHDLVKLIRHGVPKSLWKVRVKDSDLDEIAKKIEKLDPGQRLATNAQDIDIKSEQTDIRSGFSQIVSQFQDEYNMALQSFLPKFFGSSPWTESSSLTAERIWYNALVVTFQETFKEQKTIYIDDLVLSQHGFDENLTTFYWGVPKGSDPNPNMVVQIMQQITGAFTAGYIDGGIAKDLFNQLIEVLANMGITLNSKIAQSAADPSAMSVAASKLAQDVLDGNVTTDTRAMAEHVYNLNEAFHGQHKLPPVKPRKIKKRMMV